MHLLAQSILEHFLHPQKKPMPVGSHSSIPLHPLALGTHLSTLCFNDVPFLDISCNWNHPVCLLSPMSTLLHILKIYYTVARIK